MNRSKRRTFLVFAVLATFVFLFSARPVGATIGYKIHLDHPEQHVFGVEMSIPTTSPGTVVALPAWNALYQVRDFAYRVREVRAVSPSPDDTPFAVRKLDKQTWQIGLPCADSHTAMPEIIVDYSIEWDDPGPFSSQINAHHAFINLAELLMYVPDRRSEDVIVSFAQIPDGWKTISELPNGKEKDSYTAPGYDALVDAPVEAGKFDEFEFDEGGAHFRVVVDSTESKKNRLEGYLRSITRYELKLMGGLPFKQYTFFFHIGPYSEAGGGGMEHANSAAIAAGSDEGAATVAAHEFFHAWNVKRIRPQSLEPVDYTKEQYTRALWFAEGVTSTYGVYTLERCGLWNKDQLYADLASEISMLESRSARKWQSVEESSLDAWLEKYDAYSLPERSISYYNKGQIEGVMLDLAIRDATDNRRSLDDVLRRLNLEYAMKGKFYNESEGVRAVVEEVSGKSFEDFFRRYVSGTDEIPYADFLSAAGLELKAQAVKTADLGFIPGRPSATGTTVSAVQAGSAAETAGLRDGDLIVQVNGHAVPRGRGTRHLGLSAGETATLHVNRGGQELDISFQVGAREEQTYSIAEASHPTDKQHRIRNGLLHGTTD